MTLRIYISGVEIDPGRVLLPVDGGFTENADGTSARAGVTIDDPDGDLDLTGWEPFVVEEDDCTPARIFTGWAISRTIDRGPYRSGTSRALECDLVDLNQLLHLRVLTAATAKRPQESGSTRLAWLLTTVGLNGVVFDNGQVMANAWTYDASDYRGQYADDVLRDIVSANTDERWTFFLYWDETQATGEEISLFYGNTTTTTFDSTMAISNVIADQDATTIYPYTDGRLERDPSGQYGGAYLTGVFGRMYRTNATTIAAMGLTRDGTYTSQRLINSTTAQAHATRYLDWHSGETDVITCTVEVPSTQVNLILAGSRIPVKFTHLPGYATSQNVRVQNRTVTLGENWLYRVQLTLSNKGILQSGGGDPGDFPFVPPPILTYCATAPASGVSASSETDDIYATEQYRGDFVGNGHDAEVTITAFSITGFSAANWTSMEIVYSWNGGALQQSHIYAESAITPGVFDSNMCWNGGGLTNCTGTDAGSPDTTPSGIVKPTTGTDTLRIFGMAAKQNDSTTPVTFCVTIGNVIDAVTGLPVPNEIEDGGPPAPGQKVLNEFIANGDGTTTAFATDFPYAAGSLAIRVDGVPIINGLTEVDPSAGTFTLDFAPLPATGDSRAERVVADYQGI